MKRARSTLQRIGGPEPARPLLIVKSDAMLLEDIIPRYESKRLRGKSLLTSGQYWRAVRLFGEFLAHVPTVDDLDDDRVNDFQWWLVKGGVRGAQTAVTLTKKLLALWRFAARHRLAENWPEVELMPVPTRDPVAWTEQECRTIMAALRAQPGWINGAQACHWWPALWMVFYDTAERLAAVLALTMEDLNLDAAWVTFRAETRKGKLRDRGMPLHSETVEALRKIIDGLPRRKMLFEAPFSIETLRQRYKTILRDAGLPCDRKRLFHCIRKTVASHFESAGHDATELLDHSMRKVTTDSYLSPQIVRRARPASVLFRPETATDRKTAEANAQAMREAEARRYADLLAKHGDSLAGWADAYAESHPEQVEDTASKRRGKVKSFAKFLEREPTLADVTISTVMRFAVWRIEQGAAETTADDERLTLLAIKRFASELDGGK